MAELIKIDSAMVKTFEIDLMKVQEMVKKYQELKLIPKDTESYKVCRAALTHCISNRTSIDKRRLELNSEDQAKIKKRNDVAKQLTELIAPAEDYLSVLVKGEDNRKTEIKAEKERKELERIEGIRGKIADINSFGSGLTFDLTLAQLNDILYAIEAIEITPDEYMELTQEANQVKHDVHIAIRKAIEARIIFDAGEAKRKAEDERLAKEREELAKRNAEIDAKYEQQAREQAELDAEKKRLEQEEFERRAKEDAKIQAEKEAEQKLAHDQWLKEEQEKKDLEELTRREALKPDKDRLIGWIERVEIVLDEFSPEVKSGEAKDVFKVSFERIEGAILYAKNLVETL